MGWFSRKKAPKIKHRDSITSLPDGLWTKCSSCQEIMYQSEIEGNLKVCPKCGYHFRLNALRRIDLIADQGSFKEMDVHIRPEDPLEFEDTKLYKDRIATAQKKLNINEAVRCGQVKIGGHDVQIGVFEFSFMGGSMGSVVGEKITRVFERALVEKTPTLLVMASGGARMQEGIFSLMQMAKTCSALKRLHLAGLPYISLLTDPTTGGVSASVGFMGDINIAEPGALIGFAGPRVIKQTINEDLPEGFQRSEFFI